MIESNAVIILFKKCDNYARDEKYTSYICRSNCIIESGKFSTRFFIY